METKPPTIYTRPRLIGSLVLILLTMLVVMTIFESIKQLIFPHLSIWQSHIITIAFSSILATGAAYAVLRQRQFLNRQILAEMAKLELYNREITSFSLMGGMLEACVNAEEAYAAVKKFAQQLFPGTSGSLYLFRTSRDYVEAAVNWGEVALGEELFAPQDCWALRRGQVNRVDGPHTELVCRHVEKSHQPLLRYMCVKIMAQIEMLGLLYLQGWPSSANQPAVTQNTDMMEKLALAVAEQVGICLANLKLREKLTLQSIRDPLTGLFNRRYLEETLERELARAKRKTTSLAVIMLDIDYFKHFNDTFGHLAGDAFLRNLGSLLLASVRNSDLACRYGGDEFTLILPESSAEGACQRAEQLRVAVSQLQIGFDQQSQGAITLSLGMAIFPQDGKNGSTLLHAADKALYQAKREGRNCVTCPPGRYTKQIAKSILHF